MPMLRAVRAPKALRKRARRFLQRRATAVFFACLSSPECHLFADRRLTRAFLSAPAPRGKKGLMS